MQQNIGNDRNDNDGSQKAVRLWPLVFLSLVGYCVLAVWFPLFPFYNRTPLADINRFVASVPAVLAYAALFCTLYYLYHRLYQLVRRQEKGPSLGLLLLVGLLFSLPLLFTFPVNANDIYRYFIRGRITIVHNENPYLVSPAELGSAEPYLPLAGEWADKTSPYGPVWEIAAAVVSRIAPDNLPLALLLFKGLAVVGHLLIGSLIWLSLKEKPPGIRNGRTALWLWNPALLFIFATDGHNDAFMLLWLVLGWLLITRQRYQWAMVALILAPLTKLSGLLALPICFLAALRSISGNGPKVRFTVVTAVSWLALIVIFFIPFGQPFSLVQRLLVEAGAGGEFSFLALIFLVSRDVFGFAITAFSIELATRIGAGLFLILAIWLLWRTWQGRSALRGTADIFAGYLVQSFVFRIWYTAWPFAWLVLDTAENGNIDEDRFFSIRRLGTAEGRLYVGFWFLFTAQLSVLIYGQIRTSLLLGQHLYAHLIGVPFTFLLPLVLACFPWRSGRDGAETRF